MTTLYAVFNASHKVGAAHLCTLERDLRDLTSAFRACRCDL